VVRAVAASAVPIICGVGHETDFTLADFAADLRAPTPTAAAELATQTTVADLQEMIRTLNLQLASTLTDSLAERRNVLSEAAGNLRFYSPVRRIQSDRQRLDDLAHRISAGQAHRLALEESRLEGWYKRLEALNPLHVLARGYAELRMPAMRSVSACRMATSMQRLRLEKRKS
jgi:exodeoxyribonuclease VII large subunit